MHFSAAADARWVRKGSKSTLGYKGFARADEDGYIDRVHTTPANAAESPAFGHMIEGAQAQRVLATSRDIAAQYPAGQRTRPMRAAPTARPCAASTATGS